MDEPDKNWIRQVPGDPAFKDVAWSRPENLNARGKILIIGGNSNGFRLPAQAYDFVSQANVGTVRAILPNVIRQMMLSTNFIADYCNSTSSGGFARTCLSEFLAASSWADGTLLAGDFGRNSETAMLLEDYVQKYDGLICLTKDSIDFMAATPQIVFERADTILAANFGQLQKMLTKYNPKWLISHSQSLLNFITSLSVISKSVNCMILVEFADQIHVAYKGRVSSTKHKSGEEVWQLRAASFASVWAIQQPNKIFEAVTCSIAIAESPQT